MDRLNISIPVVSELTSIWSVNERPLMAGTQWTTQDYEIRELYRNNGLSVPHHVWVETVRLKADDGLPWTGDN